MAFLGVEFVEDSSLAVIRSEWLTPRKKEVLWPPFKTQDLYNKALLKGENPENDWIPYAITRTIFECGNNT